MKRGTTDRVFVYVTATVVLSSMMSMPLRAASLYWDANGSGTDAVYGGDGVWSGANANWNTSATIGSGSLQAWTGTADDAQFLKNTSGTVTVSGTQTLKSINFGNNAGSFTTGVPAYTINGGTLDIRQVFPGSALTNNVGTNVINSPIKLFGGIAGDNEQRITVNNGSSLTVGAIEEASGASGNHFISLIGAASNSTLTISGNVTKATNSSGVIFRIGETISVNDATYVLSGNNTGLLFDQFMYRGTLMLNSSTALAGAGRLNLYNLKTTSGDPDTIKVLIGTGGVTINKIMLFAALTANDTGDVRTIGGSNTSGTATFSGAVTLNAFAGSGTGSRLEVTAANGGTVDFSGLISDGVNSVPITKTGSGTVRFTRAAGNTYDGLTTVSAGTLLVNNTSGSGVGTGSVTVSTGATLGGTGFIDPNDGNNVIVNGKLAPGNNGIGTLTVGAAGSENNVLFGTAGRLVAEVSGGTKDLLAVFGDISLAGNDDILDVTFITAPTLDRYVLATYTGSRDGTFTSLAVAGSAAPWAIDYSVNGEIAIAVPEPGTMVLLAFGTIALVARRRGGIDNVHAVSTSSRN